MKRLVVGLLLLSLAGCTSYVPLGGGRYLRTQSTQEPVMWGVSNSHSMLEDCKGEQRPGYNFEKLEFSDCVTVRTDYGHAPGYGQAIVNGILQGLTFGLIAVYANGDGGSAAASASATSSAVSKGGKH